MQLELSHALPRQLEPGTVSALRAISALVGRESGPTEQVPGLGALARVLYYSAGITKVRRSPGGDVYFRAAPNTGALYHVDLVGCINSACPAESVSLQEESIF